MGNQTSIVSKPARDLNELKAIFNPVYKVVDNLLYVRTVNYLKIVDLDEITGISVDCYGCNITLENNQFDKLRQYTITLSTYYSTFSYDERQILSQELTKEVIDVFEKYKHPQDVN